MTEQGALTPWRQQREGQVRIWKESDQVRGTHSLKMAERQVRTQKESDQARGTHKLEMAEGGTSQDMERK